MEAGLDFQENAVRLQEMDTKEFDIEVQELELKYNADEIKFGDFMKFAESLQPVKRLEVASWDYYFSGNKYKLPFDFLRFRSGVHGGPAQLTIKIKEDKNNNQNRFELDIDILGSVKLFLIETLAKLVGFEENFRVYKDCMIFWYDQVDLVYYQVYDKHKKEKIRIIEIEYRKDVKCESRDAAWAAVKDLEQKMAVLGITPANRLRKSMWEMFKKD